MANTKSLDLELSSSQYLSIPDGSQTGLDLATDFTFEAWVKIEQLPSTAGTTFCLVDRGDFGAGTGQYYWVLLPANDKMRLLYTDGVNNTYFESDVAIVTAGDVGSWVHLAGSADISTQTMVLYKNGSSVAASAVQANAATIRIGVLTFYAGARLQNAAIEWYYDGLIDELRIWNDIRTSTEISDNYQQELVGNEAGLVAYWKFNNDYLDETANNNDLTAIGSPVFSTDVPFAEVVSTNMFLMFP